MKENKFLNYLLIAIRIFVGVLFIFSGLIKANDPSGLAYKMGEFFEVWAKEGYMPSLMHALNNYALLFSILMIAFEIVAGVALIIGYRFKLFAYLILLLTIFFTFLTGYALFSGNIKECGCFGDCIKLQANESFMKDLILLALLLILVFFRKHVKQSFGQMGANIIMILSLVFSFWMQWYVLKHLPFKDCLAYRVGNNILKEMTPGPDYVPAKFETILTYQKDGVKKDFTTQNFPWQDTTWKFVDSKTTEVSPAKNEPPIKDFAIGNYNGEDVTQTILNYPGHLMILFVKDVKEAKTDHMDALRKLSEECSKVGVPFMAISASNDLETAEFSKQHKLNFSFYTIDGTVCKTAMRSNPGLMWMKAGTVMGKYSYANYPSLDQLKLELKDNTQALFPEVATLPVMAADSAK